MKINFCCPTRSKPDILEDFLLETVRNCRLPDTQVVVGIDADEEPLYERFFPHPRLIKSVAPREDSLGAKFNRCAAALRRRCVRDGRRRSRHPLGGLGLHRRRAGEASSLTASAW